MNFAFISLGSNLGNRVHYIRTSVKAIEKQIGTVELLSSYYETEPWGFHAENSFINQVIKLNTELVPLELLKRLNLIEEKLERKRELSNQNYTSRTIDLDILFYENEVCDYSNLKIPHKLVHMRSFVLIPMFEISPDFVHPVLNLTIRELLLDCHDCLKVEKYIPSEILV